MKWWGWGEEGVAFRYDDKPAFAAFIKNAIDLDVTKRPAAITDLDSLQIGSSSAPPALRSALQAIVGPDN